MSAIDRLRDHIQLILKSQGVNAKKCKKFYFDVL